MSQEFDVSRFNRLLKYNARIEMKRYGLLLAVMLAIMALCFWYSTIQLAIEIPKENWDNPYDSIYMGIFVIMILTFYGVSTIGASLMWGNLSRPSKAIATLTLPASNLEKYMVRWVLFILVPPLAVIAATVIIDWGHVAILQHMQSEIEAEHSWCVLTDDENASWYGFFVIWQSTFALGAILWRRFALLKTIAIWAIFFIFIAMLVPWGLYDYNPLLLWMEESPNTFAIIATVFAAAIYALSFYRFKESDLVPSW